MTTDRLPDGTPFYALDAEREFIGAALLSEAEHVLAVTLDRNDFRDRNLGVIWAAIQESARLGNPCIPVTAWLLDKAGVLDKVGSEVLLAQLAGRALVEQPFPHLTLLTHPQIIHEWAGRRAGLAQAQTLARRAINGDLQTSRGGMEL